MQRLRGDVGDFPTSDRLALPREECALFSFIYANQPFGKSAPFNTRGFSQVLDAGILFAKTLTALIWPLSHEISHY